MLISTRRCDGTQLINRPEIDIASHEDLDPVAVALRNGGGMLTEPFRTSVTTLSELEGL